MNRRLLFICLAIALVALAVAGWTVDGARWALGAAR
jgi:hypothetical protein